MYILTRIDTHRDVRPVKALLRTEERQDYFANVRVLVVRDPRNPKPPEQRSHADHLRPDALRHLRCEWESDSSAAKTVEPQRCLLGVTTLGDLRLPLFLRPVQKTCFLVASERTV